MERPNILDFFKKDVTIEEVNEIYLNCPELYNYAQSLDNYIDELEFLISEGKRKDDVKIT